MTNNIDIMLKLEKKGECRLPLEEIYNYKNLNKKEIIDKIIYDSEHSLEEYFLQAFEIKEEYKKFVHRKLNKLSSQEIIDKFSGLTNLEEC